jgi:hypothetical protein
MAVVAEDEVIFASNSGIDPDSLFASTSGKLTDVSGSGVDLFKASVNTIGEVTGSTTAGHVSPYCFDFNVTFTNSNPEKDMAVFLSSISSIAPTTVSETDDEALANSMRVAILNSAETTSLAYYAPNEASTTQIITGVNAVQSTSTNFSASLATASDLDLTTYTQNILLSDYTTDYTDDTATTTAAAKGYIGTIAAEGSLAVTARIWLEGTDANCDNTALTGNAAVNLVFNGVSNIVTA